MMAKSDLPSVDNPRKQLADYPAPKKAEEAPAIEHEGYLPRRVDVKLTRAQATILRDKLRHLQDTGAKTADGRFVSNRTQAVQWIIENEVAIY
jgi:hypothetical protein